MVGSTKTWETREQGWPVTALPEARIRSRRRGDPARSDMQGSSRSKVDRNSPSSRQSLVATSLFSEYSTKIVGRNLSLVPLLLSALPAHDLPIGNPTDIAQNEVRFRRLDCDVVMWRLSEVTQKEQRLHDACFHRFV